MKVDKKKAIIHLAIAFDQNYLTPFYALITSVFKHNTGTKVHTHAIISGLSEEEKEKINWYFEQTGNAITYYSVDHEIVSKFVLTGKWTHAVYYRLFFPFLVNDEVERLLYLDTDTIVINNLNPLYTFDLDGCPVGAVYDNWVKKSPQLGIEHEGNYFNSGVLLIDIKKWKEQKISEKAFEYLSLYPERIKFVDQDALNAVLIGNWKKLENKYNFMYSLIPERISKRALNNLIKDVVIIHFTLQRPWQLLCKNRLRNLYFQYLRLSPAKISKRIIDFKWKKIGEFLRLRMIEFYHDVPALQKYWKKIKAIRY